MKGNPCHSADKLRKTVPKASKGVAIAHVVPPGQLVYEESLLLATASVTEAIDEIRLSRGQVLKDLTHAFSLIDIASYREARTTSSYQDARAPRSRTELLLPWIVSGKEHAGPKGMKERIQDQYKKLDQAGHVFLVDVLISNAASDINPLSLPTVCMYDSLPGLLSARRDQTLSDI